jgi:hypothetical protein
MMLRLVLILCAWFGASGSGVWLLSSPASAATMTFSLAKLQGAGLCKPDCPVIIFANGQISPDSPEDFARFVTSTPGLSKTRNAVMISSPGGQVVGALMLGLLWKQLNMTVIVAEPLTDTDKNIIAIRAARCYSACAYALIGARTRVVPDGSQVGIHRMHSIRFSRDPADNRFQSDYVLAPEDQVAILRNYTKIVGINPKLIDLAETVAPTTIRVLTAAEMKDLQVITLPPRTAPARKAVRK